MVRDLQLYQRLYQSQRVERKRQWLRQFHRQPYVGYRGGRLPRLWEER